MSRKYHIKTRPIQTRFTPIGKISAIERDGCLGCTRCAKKACVYDVYRNRKFDSKQMIDTIDYLCKNCFRCVQECKGRLFSRALNPEYLQMGDEYWKPDIIATTWYQSETGKIPVSGCGYTGPFSGWGFDSMWTDMSEIVRPTRDGIHGREYISTTIDLGRKLVMLEFTKDNFLISTPPPIVEIPIPILFNPFPYGRINKAVRKALAQSAFELGVPMIIEAEEYFNELMPFDQFMMPQFTAESFAKHKDLLKKVRLCEFLYTDSIWEYVRQAKEINPQIIISIKVKAGKDTADIVSELAKNGAEIIHIYADYQGNSLDETDKRFIKNVVLETHHQLVKESLRDEVTIISSGGIGLAEHLAKVIICGADGAGVDLPLLIALECRLCQRCRTNLSCPVEIEKIHHKWGTRRIINLIGAWHSQLIEVMGAMGIREVRRLRGEIGRAIFFDEMEKETFGRGLQR